MTNTVNYYPDPKFPAYFECAREEMLSYIPEYTKTVLDIGCGSGTFGHLLKERLSLEVWGIDLDIKAAMNAKELIDRVLVGSFPNDVDIPKQYFDCIIFNDVLEHMVDPWSALSSAKSYLTNRGCVVASIPNVRYLPVLYRLIIRGEWNYTESGILDKTHLRFFTKKSITEMFNETGYDILRIEGIYPYRRWQVTILEFLLPRFTKEVKYIDYAVLALPK